MRLVLREILESSAMVRRGYAPDLKALQDAASEFATVVEKSLDYAARDMIADNHILRQLGTPRTLLGLLQKKGVLPARSRMEKDFLQLLRTHYKL